VTDKQPDSLDKGCIVINAPTFLDEIRKSVRKKPRSNTLTTNYLREIVAAVADRYADESFNALTSVNVSPFKGAPCGDDDTKTQEAIFKIFTASYPQMFDKYVAFHIKHRPIGTKLIYFLGDFKQSAEFFVHGIDQIKEEDVPAYLGHKKKKVVGKPAVTDDQINQES
jgi:hypothetical protein